MRLSKKSKLSKISAICDKLNDDFAAVKCANFTDLACLPVDECGSGELICNINPSNDIKRNVRGCVDDLLFALENHNKVNVIFAHNHIELAKKMARSNYSRLFTKKVAYLINFVKYDNLKNGLAIAFNTHGKYNEDTDVVLFHN